MSFSPSRLTALANSYFAESILTADEVDRDDKDPEVNGLCFVLAWAELVSFDMDFWDQADVETALGADLADALPELLQLADLEVRIPLLEVVALERIAVRDGRSVDSVLARELRDLVSAQSDWLASRSLASPRPFRGRSDAVVIPRDRSHPQRPTVA